VRHEPASAKGPFQWLLTVVACVIGVVLVLCGLAVVGFLVLLTTGSIRLAPNK
jgi:hypothetical protein